MTVDPLQLYCVSYFPAVVTIAIACHARAPTRWELSYCSHQTGFATAGRDTRAVHRSRTSRIYGTRNTATVTVPSRSGKVQAVTSIRLESTRQKPYFDGRIRPSDSYA